MTKDFRQASPASRTNARGGLDPGRRLVVMTLYGSSIAFLLGGVWLLVAEQHIVAADAAPLVGAAFIIAALSDVVAVAVLKRIWSRTTPLK